MSRASKEDGLFLDLLIRAIGICAGSKAAVTAISNTLRLELEPFGVKVVTVITGAVNTNVLSSGVDLKLPSTSVYKSIGKRDIRPRLR